MAGAVRQFFAGVALLGRGFGRYRRDPRVLIAGLIPAVIAAALVLGALGVLIYFVPDLGRAVTPFADHWAAGLRDTVRVLADVSIVGIGGLVAFVTFTSVTLAIGDPFYEKIAHRVEDELGGVPGAIDAPWWRGLGRSVVESIRLVLTSAIVGIPLFIAGFLPLVGQTVVPVIGALVGGWFLAVELVSAPFERRGLRLADRRRVLRANRPLAVGFGAAVFVCFLVPLGAIVTMPAAVAGGALLTRRVLGPADAPRATSARPAPRDERRTGVPE
ncbi:MAG TPA: EI24 domain-containing protein [Micromonosporaceae bacterium]|nr:EI24 domain-containing protein [Micromonosporaceae bacterium]